MKNKINNRVILDDGAVVQTSESVFESLFVNPKIIESSFSENNEEVAEYNRWAKMFDVPQIHTELSEIDHKKNQQNWKMPQKYKDMDINEYLISLCKTDEEIDRVAHELIEYQDRGLENLLKYLVYLIDTFKEKQIVWGIGRGSSVASYVLYKIGVHRIDSLKYNLDIKEFLK
jgi:DNA polymerase III alpha subunit